jgi:hypothetical protein
LFAKKDHLHAILYLLSNPSTLFPGALLAIRHPLFLPSAWCHVYGLLSPLDGLDIIIMRVQGFWMDPNIHVQGTKMSKACVRSTVQQLL